MGCRLIKGSFPFIIAGIGIYLCGCASVHRGAGGIQETKNQVKVPADAYLFDARVYRDGKPTSVRLECYCTDSLVGLFGRGYLGKGALKGVMTRDSLTVYFPSTDEYVQESIPALLEAADSCSDITGSVDFARIFDNLPDQIANNSNLLIENVGEEDELKYEIGLSGCEWKLGLEYRLEDGRPYLNNLEIDDAHGNRLVAKRRTLKRNAQVPWGRFEVGVPATAVQIIP